MSEQFLIFTESDKIEYSAIMGDSIISVKNDSFETELAEYKNKISSHRKNSLDPSRAPSRPSEYYQFKILEKQHLKINYHLCKELDQNKIKSLTEASEPIIIIIRNLKIQYLSRSLRPVME